MKFRKKPVVIEAVQFAGSEMDARNILQWAGAKCGMFSPQCIFMRLCTGTTGGGPRRGMNTRFPDRGGMI